MSRNSRKFNKNTQNTQAPPQPSNHMTEKRNDINELFGLSFVTPTEEVSLPTAGMHYPKNSPLFNVDQVEIRHMTSKEEDLLSGQQSFDTEFKIYDKLIDSLLVDPNIKSSMLLEEDKFAILLSARQTGYGSDFSTEVYCEKCKKNAKHVFDLSKTSINEAKKESEYVPEEDVYLSELPKSKIKVKISSNTAKIEKDLELEKKQKEKYNLPFNRTVSYISKLIISANDVYDESKIAKLAEVLPAIDAKFLIEFHSTARPTLSTLQEVQCTACNYTSEREAPLTWAFFRAEF